MAEDDETCCGQTNEELAEEKGWLDENGICHFPPDVVACTTGYIAPGVQVAKLNTKQLKDAVAKGLIKFKDGNGDPHTFDEYVKLYSGYPDPVWQLEMNDRWPPKGIVQIGGGRR